MSVRYKRELMTYLLFDYEGIEEHLEKMAAKGWYLETPGNTVWKYREGEPAEVKYAVTYVPKASQFDPEPIEEQRTLEEFCREAGWEKAGDFLQAQIYMNRRPDPVPIETEEEVRLEVIRKAMKKSFVPAHVVLVLLMLFNLWIGMAGFFSNPMSSLAGYGSLLSVLFMPISVTVIAANPIAYFVWLKRSAKSVESGGRCVSPKVVRMLNKWELPVILVYFIGMVTGLAGEGNTGGARYMVLYMIGFFGLVSLLNVTKNFMKKRGVSRGTNIAVFIIVDIIGAFAMVSLVMWMAFSAGPSDYAEPDPYAPEIHETFLVKQTRGELEEPNIYYEVNEIKAEGLFYGCLNSRLRPRNVMRGLTMEYEMAADEETALWHADQAYYSDWWGGRWILTKDNYIVEISGADELTDAEKSGLLAQLGIE